jgi:translation initiation factor IF-1
VKLAPDALAETSKSHPDEIRAPARVVKIMRDRAYRLELPNGHRCIGRAEKEHAPLAEGDAVVIAFHPYDISRGWIRSGS